MILVLDLDDTLYPEIEFVKSGFKAVSNYLSANYNLKSDSIYNQMLILLDTEGRGQIFDSILKENKIFNAANKRKCVSVYRSHTPLINLYPEAERFIERFKNNKKYIITDGNKVVQRNKIKALNLNPFFIKTIPTYQYGIKYSKPSTFCFEKIIQWENCNPKDIIYIGDNPKKDFVNLNKIGCQTIRVLTGGYKDLTLDSTHEAKFTFNSLDEITIEFITNFINLH